VFNDANKACGRALRGRKFGYSPYVFELPCGSRRRAVDFSSWDDERAAPAQGAMLTFLVLVIITITNLVHDRVHREEAGSWKTDDHGLDFDAANVIRRRSLISTFVYFRRSLPLLRVS
jgi:hypothetical protein